MFNYLDAKTIVATALAIIAFSFFLCCEFRGAKIDKLNNLLAVQNAQFQSLADSYKKSLEYYETQKYQIEFEYKKKIENAKKIEPNEECEYLKNRIKEFAR